MSLFCHFCRRNIWYYINVSDDDVGPGCYLSVASKISQTFICVTQLKSGVVSIENYERGYDEPSNAVKSNSRCNSDKRLTYYYKFLIINAVCSEQSINIPLTIDIIQEGG